MLKVKIGSQEAEAFVSLLHSRVEKEFSAQKDILATKTDIANSEARLTFRMFLFWIGQLGAFVAMIKLLL